MARRRELSQVSHDDRLLRHALRQTVRMLDFSTESLSLPLQRQSPDEVPVAASKVKAFATEALSRIGVDGVQLHGAVGYTEEYDIQLYLKRSKWSRPAFGDENYHLDRVATLGGL